MRLFELHEQQLDLEKFESDCKPFLEAMRGATTLPYHGSKVGPFDWEIKEFRERGRPRDTRLEIHDAFNKNFREEFNFPFRNGMFLSGNRSDAQIYGSVFVIFPIGKFEFLWSPWVEDLTVLFDTYKSDAHRQDDRSSYDENIKTATDRMMDDLANDMFKYRHNTDLTDALNSKNEIMLKCEKFYCFNYLGGTYDAVHSMLVEKNYLQS